MIENTKYVIAAVVPGQEPAVVMKAALVADAFDAELVCTWVDESRYEVGRDESGGDPGLGSAVYSASLDPDSDETRPQLFDPILLAEINQRLSGVSARFTTRALAGSAFRELSSLADELDAEMIVVGTRKPSFRGAMHEFFSGSVAVQLAHHQHRPVLVIPVSPVGLDGEPPWAAAG